MIEHILRRFLELPSRRWIVITVTFLIGLVVLWPLVDEYLVLLEQQSQLSRSIVSTRKDVGQLSLYEKRLTEKATLLAGLERETLSETMAREFRTKVVTMVRESGCQIRRIQLIEPRTRKWHKKDNPIRMMTATEKGKETKFELVSQQLKLSVTGPMHGVKDLLERMDATEKLIHTTNFSLQPGVQDRNLIELDLEIILFDLVKPETVST